MVLRRSNDDARRIIRMLGLTLVLFTPTASPQAAGIASVSVTDTNLTIFPASGNPPTGHLVSMEPGDIMDAYLSGDCAPEARFNYRFTTAPISAHRPSWR